ncbi:unnamed protein product [Rotaria sordida]|uniref:Uncharacterized protein n=1 Tax=Rotaria sordida TaxID=392033 RepID=A0A819P3V3_9BILA|nr:unnamed protein product [Rotaria sordida]
MELAIEKFRKYCHKYYRSDEEIIELWTNILSKYDLSTLADEKWLILETVCKSALHCSKQSIARQCLEQLEQQFETTNPRIITLNAMYFESIGEYEKAEEISSKLIENNETNVINKLLALINYLVDICINFPDCPSSCLKSIQQYCQQINEAIDDSGSCIEQNDFKTILIEIKNFIELMNLNDFQQEKINRIISVIKNCSNKFSNDNIKTKAELINVKHSMISTQEKQDAKIKKVEEKIDELHKEMSKLKETTKSNEIISDVFAYLLQPFTDKVKAEFEKMNAAKNEAKYDFLKCYNIKVLEKIQSNDYIKTDTACMIDNLITEFVADSQMERSDFIELLMDKKDRNYKCHTLLNNYIDDIINKQNNENTIIEFLEENYPCKIIIDDEEKDKLIKLICLNIKLKKKNNLPETILDQHFNSFQHHDDMIHGQLRMPIVDQYKEMGTIVMGKIESGCCRVGDECIIMPNEIHVEITNIYNEDYETDSSVYGENVRLKLKNIEEKEISSGFILCNAKQKLCRVGRIFESEITIIKYPSKIYPGYLTDLHIHTNVAEVRLKKLIALIHPETGEKILEDPKFIQQNQVAIARFELSQSQQIICMELFKDFPRLGRFALCDEVEGSICVRDDRLAIGDQITEVNDQSFNEFSNVKALYLL